MIPQLNKTKKESAILIVWIFSLFCWITYFLRTQIIDVIIHHFFLSFLYISFLTTALQTVQ